MLLRVNSIEFCKILELHKNDVQIVCYNELVLQSEGNEEDGLSASLPGGTTIVLQNPSLDKDRPDSPDTTSTYALRLITFIKYNKIRSC